MISAANGTGLDKLLEAIAKELPPTRRQAKLLLPYSAAATAARFRTDGKILSEEYTENGILLEVIAEMYLLDENKNYIVTE